MQTRTMTAAARMATTSLGSAWASTTTPPVGTVARDKLYFIEADHLGTPRVVLDPQRDKTVWRSDLTGEPLVTPPRNKTPATASRSSSACAPRGKGMKGDELQLPGKRGQVHLSQENEPDPFHITRAAQPIPLPGLSKIAMGAVVITRLRLFALSTLLSGLFGCLHVPMALQQAAAREGVHAVQVNNIGPIHLVQSASYLSGSMVSVEPSLVLSCASKHLVVDLVSKLPPADASKVCQYLLAGIEYVASFSNLTTTLRYRVVLLADGAGYLKVRRNIGSNSVDVAFAFRWSDSSDTSAAIDAVSHETVHLIAGLTSLPSIKRQSESEAYIAGICARLSVTGVLSRNEVQLDSSADERDLSLVVLASNRAGRRLEARVLPYFGDAIDIHSGERSGKALMAECARTLTDYFEVSK